jgi:predicted esterase
MKTISVTLITIILLFHTVQVKSQSIKSMETINSIDKVKALKDTLAEMEKRTDNALFKNHCKSFTAVIDAQIPISAYDSSLLSIVYDSLCNTSAIGNAKNLSSYLNRQRSFIIAWESPTDGVVSFSTLKLPKDWDPEKAYPVYISLHGLWDVANLPISYMTYNFRKGPSSTFSYEDGYSLSPWGRGNLWYQGISETDIWECKAEVERLVKIDLSRQYISGHSMGGYGAWYIASKSADTWAAMGIQAGALWYNGETLLYNDVIQNLSNLPTYFVCGTLDGLLDVNQRAYNLLNNAGNENTEFVTFVGGHESLSVNVENMYLWLKDFVNDDYTNITNSEFKNTDALQCYPNPFKTSTTLQFKIDKPQWVRLSIYNSEGKLIETLVNKTLSAGVQEIKYYPKSLKAGFYYCKLESEGKQIQHKMVVIK